MKRLLILLIFSIVFESCIEKLDSAEPKFEKLYGYNANSIASGIAECSDGSYLIYGSADKTRLDMENSNGGTTEDQMPILIKIDQHGNEIISRTYPIKQLLYEIEFDGINRFNIYEAWFTTAIQMNNGKYFATFYGQDDLYIHNGYMILNEMLMVERIRLIDDSELEFLNYDTHVFRTEHQTIKSPIDNDVLLLAKLCAYTDANGYPVFNEIFYSILKISMEGELHEVMDFNDPYTKIATDIIVGSDNKVLVIGELNFSGEETFVHRIDIEEGIINDEYIIKNGSSTLKYQKLISNSEGFVSAKPTVWDYDSLDGVIIQFYNKNFELTDSVYHEQSFHRVCGVYDLIHTEDGGYCLLYGECRGYLTINRLDPNGQSIWKWDWEANPGEGYRIQILETPDGGILYLGNKKFNSTGSKISLLKLNSEGNIQWN